jgi:hypothetical protein
MRNFVNTLSAACGLFPPTDPNIHKSLHACADGAGLGRAS